MAFHLQCSRNSNHPHAVKLVQTIDMPGKEVEICSV